MIHTRLRTNPASAEGHRQMTPSGPHHLEKAAIRSSVQPYPHNYASGSRPWKSQTGLKCIFIKPKKNNMCNIAECLQDSVNAEDAADDFAVEQGCDGRCVLEEFFKGDELPPSSRFHSTGECHRSLVLTSDQRNCKSQKIDILTFIANKPNSHHPSKRIPAELWFCCLNTQCRIT